MKQISKFFLKLLVSLVLLIILFLKIDINAFIGVFNSVNPYFLLIALALTFLAYLISTYKWKLALLAQDINISFRKLLASYAISLFFGTFLPTSYGGDIVRVYDTAKISNKKIRSFTAVFIDRYIGMLILLTFGLIASFFVEEFFKFIPVILFALILSLLFFLLSSYRVEEIGMIRGIMKFDKKHIIKRLRESVSVYMRRPKYVFLIFLVSLLLQLDVIVIAYIIALSVGLELPLAVFFFIVPLINIIVSLPLSINGLGVREVGYVYLFSLINVPNHVALFMSLTSFVVRVVASLLGGAAFLFRGKVR